MILGSVPKTKTGFAIKTYVAGVDLKHKNIQFI